jgi:hypothetical protein
LLGSRCNVVTSGNWQTHLSFSGSHNNSHRGIQSGVMEAKTFKPHYQCIVHFATDVIWVLLVAYHQVCESNVLSLLTIWKEYCIVCWEVVTLWHRMDHYEQCAYFCTWVSLCDSESVAGCSGPTHSQSQCTPERCGTGNYSLESVTSRNCFDATYGYHTHAVCECREHAPTCMLLWDARNQQHIYCWFCLNKFEQTLEILVIFTSKQEHWRLFHIKL